VALLNHTLLQESDLAGRVPVHCG